MLPTQQVVSQIKRPKYIQKRPGDTHTRNNLMLHRAIVVESLSSPNASGNFARDATGSWNYSQKFLSACTKFRLVLK